MINLNTIKIRRIYWLLLLVFINSYLFSLSYEDLDGKTYDVDYDGPRYSKIVFKEKSLSYYSEDLSRKENPVLRSVEGEYCISNVGGLDYIIIKETGEKWLVLSNPEGFILLYDKNGLPFFEGTQEGSGLSTEYLYIHPEDLFKADSFLVEEINGKTITYDNSNFTLSGKIPYPWVEGELGYGIGVKITSVFGIRPGKERRYLFFSNGYVSYFRPDLYEKNSRIKKLVVTNQQTKASTIIDLEDTPNIQLLDITDILLIGEGIMDIELEILEVYKGTKYKDTCINILGKVIIIF